MTTQLHTPMVVIVRDGWGTNPHPEHDKFNAVKLAATPRCDALKKSFPWTLIATSSEDVGLPEGTMGNSEVGHQNIGAGRIVDQESVHITKQIRTGEFFKNPALVRAVDRAKTNGKTVHILGIASDAGVHGLLNHLYACVELCKKQGVSKVALHLLTDGRDTGPYSGKGFITNIEAKLNQIGVGKVASVCGRYWAMDRDNRWERVKRAYGMLTGYKIQPSFDSAQAAIEWGGVFNVGKSGSEIGAEMAATDGPVPTFATAAEAMQAYYDNPTNDSQNGDEFITPRIIATSGREAASTRISDGDTVIFYNYRGDRPREITRAFMQPDFFGNVKPSPESGNKGFDRGKQLDLAYVCMTAYEQVFTTFPGLSVAYIKPPKMVNIAGEYIASLGLKQFRCAETEKFPHVTFFFNDYRDEPFPGEDRKIIPSAKVATYDLQPEMSAPGIRDAVLEALDKDYALIVVNFANGDMVGHTGKLSAAIKAIETVDACVGAVVDKTLARGGQLIVTADHGNAEQMFDPQTNDPHTAHTLYTVECILVDKRLKADTKLREGGRLADIVPTALKMMGLAQPKEMTGESLM